MRLVTFTTETPLGTVRRLGALVDDRVVDLRIAFLAQLSSQGVEGREAQRVAATTLPEDMESFIRVGLPGIAAAEGAIEFAKGAGPDELRGPGNTPGIHLATAVRILSPLSNANSLRDFVAFEDHAKAGAERRGDRLAEVWYERPIYYKGNHRSLVGPEADVPKPRFTNELDFELEVACVLGGSGRDLDEAQAEGAIYGFTILNDWSARDVQRLEMAARLGPAKSKDFATSLGPCLLTVDEVGPHPSLSMSARLNGEVICNANLGDTYWRFPQMISFVSQDEDIWPTDIYGSGTPFGGCLLDRDGPYLKPGDVVELEVEKIGVLRNVIG